ncbi:MAG: BMP family ABC transporter substrate-binding protein [Lachnospiraceae bacterium]|nr:BMP family ABC transporter substrate-binding protein [Lachnospiraceae bacterium]
MSTADFQKAVRLGKKEVQSQLLKGKPPTIPALDDIVPMWEGYSRVNLGTISIRLDRVAGTVHEDRAYSFAANFMPLKTDNQEFETKWIRLSDHHLEEGIHDPVKAYEYMNRFYIEEGNKRISVLKFFDAVSFRADVTRLIPPKSDEKENRLYYEFMRFYDVSSINDLEFSEPGSFTRLLEILGKKPDELWSDEERQDFLSLFRRFSEEYSRAGGNRLSITEGDAFLKLLTIYDYQSLNAMPMSELRDTIRNGWQEFKLLNENETIELKTEPTREKKPLLFHLLPSGTSHVKAVFIYEKSPDSSAWSYGHELGRLYLEETFPGEIETTAYENITADTAEEAIKSAIEEGAGIIFTTTPAFATASVKMALAYPKLRILNCSVGTSYQKIRTYYPRMHEAKFLVGAIAAALSENNRLFYLADYPIHGSIANINAFALGAKMINPRAKVYLEWSGKKNVDIPALIKELSPDCISGRDLIIPERATPYFGLFLQENDITRRMAIPACLWGKFYSELIRAILDGVWEEEEKSSGSHAINYFWGMSASVVDVILSRHLPEGTRRLVEFLKAGIRKDIFTPFYGILRSQEGVVSSDPERALTPQEIVDMKWLSDNVIGAIPAEDELLTHALPLFKQSGVQKE